MTLLNADWPRDGPPIGDELNLPLFAYSPIDSRKSFFFSCAYAASSLRMQWVHISNQVSVLLADPVLSFALEP